MIVYLAGLEPTSADLDPQDSTAALTAVPLRYSALRSSPSYRPDSVTDRIQTLFTVIDAGNEAHHGRSL
jgi:hypothetical protein